MQEILLKLYKTVASKSLYLLWFIGSLKDSVTLKIVIISKCSFWNYGQRPNAPFDVFNLKITFYTFEFDLKVFHKDSIPIPTFYDWPMDFWILHPTFFEKYSLKLWIEDFTLVWIRALVTQDK